MGVSRRFRDSTAAAIAILFLVSGVARAQWLNYPTPGLPRTPDGKPNLRAPSPRTADGKPDLSGIWQVTDEKWAQNIAVDIPGGAPFQPWAEALYKQRMDDQGKDEPDIRCLPRGVPKINAVVYPFRIIQTPGLVAILYETFTLYRQIFTDGRALPKDPNPTWLGYSVGRWEGDTLVVNTAGFNGKTWLDFNGHPTTDSLHVVERFRRQDFGHLTIEVTIDDPKAYTRPWTTTEHFDLLPDTELLEFICNESEKDLVHSVGK